MDALTQHGEDEVLGRVDLQGPLVVVLPLVVLPELLDQTVQVLHAGRRPEVQFGPAARAAVLQPPCGRGGAVPEAARRTGTRTGTRTGPTGESRCRHGSSRACTLQLLRVCSGPNRAELSHTEHKQRKQLHHPHHLSQ